MKHLIPLILILSGALLTASPFLYSWAASIYIESLTDEFITYLVMGTGIMCIIFGYNSSQQAE